MRYKLGYSDKIHTRKVFSSILKSGERFSSKEITAVIQRKTDGKSRLGIILSGKIFKSSVTHVKRNRLKRRIREIFRLNRHKFLKTADIIIIPKNSRAAELNYRELEERFFEIIKKARLIQSSL